MDLETRVKWGKYFEKSNFRISSRLLDRQDLTDTPSHSLEKTCLKNSVDVGFIRSSRNARIPLACLRKDT
ncbi:hypothetical protein PM082_000298 [Marasmius tenuissimus]|nr:hypothetical protein PM082_000298 [Marasmius tenuissimus]